MSGDDIRDLIERGSLGTPEAKAIRATVSSEDVERVLLRVRELEVRQLLAEVYTEEGVEIWLNSRNTMLALECPNDLLKTKAGAKRVLEVARGLTGGYSA